VDLMNEIVVKLKESRDVIAVRKMYMAKKDSISDFTAFGSALYKHVIDIGLVSDLDGILKMTDMLYQLNVVIDKEAGFFGLVAAIAKWMK